MYVVTHALVRGSNTAFFFNIANSIADMDVVCFFFYFFIPDSSNLTRTSEEILQ